MLVQFYFPFLLSAGTFLSPQTRDAQTGSTRDMRARVLLAPLSRVGLARFPPPRPLPARALFHCRTLCTAPPGASEPPKDARGAPGPEGAKEDLSEAAQRARLLEAAMQLVPEKGWTVDALSSAAVGLGLSPAAHGILARGPVELVEHFVSGCDAALAKELQERHEELAELEIQNRLLLAMQSRLQMLEPHVDTWSQAGRDGRPARRPPRTPPSPKGAGTHLSPPPRQALALRTLPTNLPTTLHSAHALASTFLEACGGDAQSPLAPALVDPHLKRVAIGAIYGAAELYMLTDKSPGFSDTFLFVEREVSSLHSVAGVARQLQAYSPANLLMTLLSQSRR